MKYTNTQYIKRNIFKIKYSRDIYIIFFFFFENMLYGWDFFIMPTIRRKMLRERVSQSQQFSDKDQRASSQKQTTLYPLRPWAKSHLGWIYRRTFGESSSRAKSFHRSAKSQLGDPERDIGWNTAGAWETLANSRTLVNSRLARFRSARWELTGRSIQSHPPRLNGANATRDY